MSPRIEIEQACPYCQVEQFTSSRHGVIRITYICHHPEKEGCLCVLDPRVGEACIYFQEEHEEEEAQP
jgi:hypothetical protein